MKILVVDDVELNQKLLVAAVRDMCDRPVLVAQRATEAIELCIQHCPDLVFMDICLPDIDGLGAIAMIKANPLLQHIPIVVVSAYAQYEYAQRAKDLGCDGYLVKPISVHAVREVVSRYQGDPLHTHASRAFINRGFVRFNDSPCL